MPAIQDDGHIDIDDVGLQQPPVARDAVADDVVDAGADGFREAAIVQRGGLRVMGKDEVMAQAIQLGRGDAWAHMGCDHIQAFRRQAARGTHADEILRGVNGNPPRFGAAVHAKQSYDDR